MNVLSLVVMLLCILGGHGHDWKFGSCPTISPFKGLSLEKFLGLWYVIEQYDTSAKCLTFEYVRDSETSLKVTKHRQYSALDSLGLNHTNTYTGSLDIPFAENQAFMRVKWPLNAAGKGDYIIFDTDYTGYAGIYDCQQITGLFFRQNAAILSRTPQLDEIYIDRVRRRLESFKVPTKEELDRIDHTNCRSAEMSKYNIGVDGDTFKDIFTQTGETLSNAAKTVADGVQGAATYVADGVRNIGTHVEAGWEATTGINDTIK